MRIKMIVECTDTICDNDIEISQGTICECSKSSHSEYLIFGRWFPKAFFKVVKKAKALEEMNNEKV
jgi:hypothetical protein